MTGQHAELCGYSPCTWHCSALGLCVEGGRTPEAEHWSQSTTGVSTHTTDPVTLTNIMTAGLIPREWPGAKREEMRRSVARRATQQATTIQCAAALFLPCNTDWSVSTPSFLMGFCKLPIIHWYCGKHTLCLFLSLCFSFSWICKAKNNFTING